MSLLQLTAKEAKLLPSKSHESDDNAISESHSSNCTTDIDNIEVGTRAEDFEDSSEVPSIALRMLHFCRELTIFCLVMVTYAALTKDPPKISRAPVAYPFFPKTPLLTDWYRGHISKAIEDARSNDVAFVMFYAPWDAESQAARKEFESAAEHMHEYVKFTAVNCWQPNSECRTQYMKVYSWPVFIAYPSHGRGVQYNGPISAFHMIQFLQKVCNPILRISNDYPKEFDDAYVIAELDASPGSLAFAVVYTAALRYLERDPQHRITFYVKPSAVSNPSLHLYLWNETLVYPVYDEPWLPNKILQWIIKNVRQVTSWVLPSGSKSMTLSSSMQNRPTLILFTPRNPLRVRVDYYHMQIQKLPHSDGDTAKQITTDMFKKKMGDMNKLFSENQEKLEEKDRIIVEKNTMIHTFYEKMKGLEARQQNREIEKKLIISDNKTQRNTLNMTTISKIFLKVFIKP
ncbi:hypothetical protein JTB14_002869 [Gonioctena quinquepunctata]|nr:hypothetical protein JTB14_002869 [Gonioctena quinquepunctata]